MLSCCFLGIWFDRWYTVCLWHLHHLLASQEHQAAHGGFYRWEQQRFTFMIHSKHVRHDNKLLYFICTTPCFISSVLLFFIQMTEFKHSKTHVLLPRMQQKNKEEFVQKLTKEWIRKDDGQQNEQVTVLSMLLYGVNRREISLRGVPERRMT